VSRFLHIWDAPPSGLTTNREVIDWYVNQARGRPVTALPPAQDQHRAIAYLRARGRLSEVFEEASVDGQLPDPRGVSGYRLRPGVTLRPGHVSPGNVADTLRAVAVMRDVRGRHRDLLATPLLVSVPHPIDLALLTHLGPSLPVKVRNVGDVRAALQHLPVYVDAVLEFITAVAGPDVLFALDMPSALVGMWTDRVILGGPQADARWHAGVTAKLLHRLPGRAEVILQLGYTDDHRADIFRPLALSAVTSYLNRLARKLQHPRHTWWRPGHHQPNGLRRLPPVYIPVAFGTQPPSLDPVFYAGLTKLDAAWDRLIPGVVDGADEPTSRGALDLFEIAAGRTSFAVARGCGMPSCSLTTAEDTVRVQRALADAKPRSPVAQLR
jgi:hypothetical protein